nr:reverse transcriptase domain-containing protein [Tanacetum cinerariifolium]
MENMIGESLSNTVSSTPETENHLDKAWIAYICEDLPRTVAESADSAVRSARSLQQNSSSHIRTLQGNGRTAPQGSGDWEYLKDPNISLFGLSEPSQLLYQQVGAIRGTRVNIQEFCEEHYEDILPIIMEKIRHDRRKDVHTRLDFGEGARERVRKDSYSNARARASEPGRVKVQDRLKYGSRHVLDRLRHRRQSAFDRFSDTYSPSTTKSRPQRTNSRDSSRSRGYTRTLSVSRDDRHKDRECLCGTGESYGDSFSHSYRDGSDHRHMKRKRDKSPPSSVSKSDSSNGSYRKSIRHQPTDEDDLKKPWMCEEENPIDGYKDLKAAFLVYFMQQKKYVKDPVEIHSIKQRDGETIEDFMERFKIETGRMKGAPECLRISRFMHGVNNPKLTKRLNEHVPKTMEEMMITTTAFIRGEAAATSKKKGHASWKPQDQPKRHSSDKRSDFRGHPRGERGSNRFTPLTKTPKEILATEASHSTDECMQLKKQIEELVRAGKLSHLIKEIKQGRDQSKTGKKETAAKDKPTAIYMVQSWQRTVKQMVTQSFERVREIAFLQLTASNGTEGPLVIEAEMGGHMIHCMYIDGDYSMEILYKHCFNRLRPEIKGQMVPAIWPLGQLRLLVTIGDTTHSTKAWMNFMVVKSMSPYNGIIGRPGLKVIQAVPFTVHGMLKFPVEGGIATICSTILIPTECASVTTSSVTPEERTRPANFTVDLHPDFPDQEVVIRGSLSDKGRTKLCSVLKKNLVIFVWQPSDMTGAPERARAIQAEVQKLVDAKIMREVYYHDWLSNPVRVKKPDGSWRMCVDFTDLNRACPQDCYPLPEFDWKVESLFGYPFKCFLDAYKGYHQIQLAEADEEKTAFHTGQRVYCYTNMPFGLKNAGATYQRMMDKAFESQVGRNIEVYVDDLVVKSHTEAEMVRDIEETFRTLCKVNMKLNPKKCSFGLAEGVFLGYLITPEGIKPCPDKTATVLQLPSPQTVKERGPDDGKRNNSNTDLLHKPGVTGSGAKLFAIGEIGSVTSLCSKEALTVFSGSPYHGHYRLTHQAGNDSPGCDRAAAKVEHYARRAQHYIQTEDVEGVEFTYELRFQFAASNNEAGYEALVAVLRRATQIGVKNIQVNIDSKLVANQVLGTYVAKEDNVIKYLEIVKGLVNGFTTFLISQVLVEVLEDKSIKEKQVAAVIEEDGPTWMTQLVDYLKEGVLPGDNKEVKKLRLKARQYELMKGVLYRRSFLTPWLRCVGPLHADYVIREIHEGSCSMHAGPRSVVAKAIRLGYYWPTMHQEARDMIRKCNDCQIHRPVTRHPQQPLTPITAPWSFYKWGIDIAGPFLEGPRKVKFLIVAMDYFTKWVKAKAVATITDGQFASVKHPRSNGLVERANRSLGEGIKARLGEGNKNWVEELPHVLWAHRTMIKSSHSDTSFSLTYGTEAVIPAKIGMPTYRIAAVDVVNNEKELCLNLDLLEERRERAAVCEARAKSKVTKYYNAWVCDVAFKPGDFVYRSNDASHAVAGGKLRPKWEGPYEVTEALGNGAYKLRCSNGTVLPRTWNVTNLKRCYL